MPMPTSRALRRIFVAALLPMAALAASCAPEPPATAPTCPALQAGAWSGSWASATNPGIGGGALAQLVATSTSVGGTFSLSGSVLGQPAMITGTISCDKVQAITSDGITMSGTISPAGDAISGTYNLRTPADHGAFDIEKVDTVA
ncbi:MAG: hypothetical protein IT194_05085 [Microthrixaceae bacterium]|nr:hypothetical protein [Microthrixaceae bacterium]